jgi:hypothetical protein
MVFASYADSVKIQPVSPMPEAGRQILTIAELAEIGRAWRFAKADIGWWIKDQTRGSDDDVHSGRGEKR